MASRKKNSKIRQKERGTKKKEKKFNVLMQKKLLVVFGVVSLFLFFLNLRIAGITLRDGDDYSQQVLAQKYYDSSTIPYRRGDIVDRNGNIFASSEKVYNVVLDCVAINSDENYLEPTIEALDQVFEIDTAEIRDRITSEETRKRTGISGSDSVGRSSG